MSAKCTTDGMTTVHKYCGHIHRMIQRDNQGELPKISICEQKQIRNVKPNTLLSRLDGSLLVLNTHIFSGYVQHNNSVIVYRYANKN